MKKQDAEKTLYMLLQNPTSLQWERVEIEQPQPIKFTLTHTWYMGKPVLCTRSNCHLCLKYT
jgi:hypothetical protein